MTDDKLFHFLVARGQAREAVSLTLATITSSASLILLALFFTVKQEIPELIIVLGILFPLIGFAYIETTYRGIHKHDHEWKRILIAEEHLHNKENRTRKETEKILVYKKNRIIKIILVRIIFTLPIFGWFFIMSDFLVENYFVGIGMSIYLLGTIFALHSTDKIKGIQTDDPKRE